MRVPCAAVLGNATAPTGSRLAETTLPLPHTGEWVQPCAMHVLLLFLVSVGHAAEDAVDASLMAMGSAATAAVDDNGAITNNPGGIGLSPRWDIAGSFVYGAERGLHWGGSAVDAVTSEYLAIGAAYSGDNYTPTLATPDLPGWSIPGEEIENTKRYHDLTVAAATNLLNRRLGIGVGGNFSYLRHDREEKGSTGNMDAGAALRPIKHLTFGLAGHNLLPISHPESRPLNISAGVRWEDREVGAAAADVRMYPTLFGDGPLGLSVGGDKTIGTLRLRAGFRHLGPAPVLERNRATWGFAIWSGPAELGYAMAIPVGVGGDTVAGMVNQVSIRAGGFAGNEDPY
jgi:hypothetical protein